MPSALLTEQSAAVWFGRLVSEGWAGAAKFDKRIAHYLSTYTTDRRALCVPRTGWHNGVYVFPDAVIGNPHIGEDIVLQTSAITNPFQKEGTLSGWQESVGTWAQGNSLFIFILSLALAPPLLRLAGLESGGINLCGGSSTGKTTLLRAAASVWGKGALSGGYIHSWRSTANGMEGLAATLSGALFCLDEIGQATSKDLSDATYMLANGVGKTRAARDGRARKASSWETLVLSTGEKGVAAKIEEKSGKIQAGQSVRLIDLPADAGQGRGAFEDLHGFAGAAEFAEAIGEAAATHYGHLARKFIAEVVANMEVVRKKLLKDLPKAMKRICGPEADGQVKRVARRFQICAVAGELAIEWELVPWEKHDALKAATSCFQAWVAERGNTGAAEDSIIISQVLQFLESHGSGRFQNLEEPDERCLNRVGFRRKRGDNVEYLILPESFRNVVCQGLDYKRAARTLREKGFLIHNDGLQYKPTSPLPGMGRKRCYCIALESEEADED